MGSTRSYSTFATEGSLALAAQDKAPRLTVIDGGRPSSGGGTVEGQATASRSISRAFIVAAIIVIALAFGAGLAGQAAHERALKGMEAGISTQTYVVGGGDSLWSIAESHPVEGLSTKDVVSYLQERNGLSRSALSVGQALEVPVSSRQ